MLTRRWKVATRAGRLSAHAAVPPLSS
eukprot:COSAG01_NODE_58547_length_305_cov_1.004854_1_plen_26_part_01